MRDTNDSADEIAKPSQPTANTPPDTPPDTHADADSASAWLTVESQPQIEALLRKCGVCQPDEQVTTVNRAGDGNMNLTLRVRTTAQTVIFKQSRPWVEKYPQIAAPVERILQELRFYETVAEHSQLASRMPRLLGSAPERYVMVVECLGKANDASALYRSGDAANTFRQLLPDLLSWLSELHQLAIPVEQAEDFANRKLRELNHQHLFVIPFSDPPALDLDSITPGLAKIAQPLAADTQLLTRLQQLGEIYLADHPQLVHGDFFPGSWLICDGELRIIDPEFSHGGLPEFDLGVLLAHGQLLNANSSDDLLTELRSHYPETPKAVDWRLVEDFAAVEVLRRLLGVAQLPLDRTLEQKKRHVARALAQLLR